MNQASFRCGLESAGAFGVAGCFYAQCQEEAVAEEVETERQWQVDYSFCNELGQAGVGLDQAHFGQIGDCWDPCVRTHVPEENQPQQFERVADAQYLAATRMPEPVAQSWDGKMLYDVRDTGKKPGNGVRPDITRARQNLHTDNSYNLCPPDYVALLCINTACLLYTSDAADE